MKKLEPSPCPYCGKVHDGAMAADGQEDLMPVPGNLSICYDCLEVMAYDENLKLVRLPDGQIEKWKQEEPEVYANLQEHKQRLIEFKKWRHARNQ
jgi:hypothetical protein